MGARAILTEMRDLLKAQADAVVAGEHQQVLAGAMRHEELLGLLDQTEIDATAEELRDLAAEIDRHKQRLQSLLASESLRVDFLLRLLLGGGGAKSGGYPASIGRSKGMAGRLNRRT